MLRIEDGTWWEHRPLTTKQAVRETALLTRSRRSAANFAVLHNAAVPGDVKQARVRGTERYVSA
jgi:hypothetical protein